MHMTVLRKLLVPAVIVPLLTGCLGGKKFPSTARVKLKVSKIAGEASSIHPDSATITRVQAGAITGNIVLSMAVTGGLSKVTWTLSGPSGVSEPSSEAVIDEFLPDLIRGSSDYTLGMEISPVRAQGEPLTEVLGKTAGRKEEYTEDKAIKIIKRNLQARPVGGTSTIEITYYSDDAQEAKVVADRIAEAYVSFVREETARTIMSDIESAAQYRSTVSTMPGTGDVVELEAELDNIIRKYGLEMDEKGDFVRPREITEKTGESLLLTGEISSLRSDLQRIRGMGARQQALYFSARGREDVSKLYSDVRGLEADIRILVVEHEEDDPEVAEKRAKLKAMKERLEETIRQAVSDMQKELVTKEAKDRDLREEIDRRKEDYGKGTSKYFVISQKLDRSTLSPGATTEGRRSTIDIYIGASFEPGQLSAVRVSVPSSFFSTRTLIVLIVSLLVLLNIGFVLFMVRWARNKKRPQY